MFTYISVFFTILAFVNTQSWWPRESDDYDRDYDYEQHEAYPSYSRKTPPEQLDSYEIDESLPAYQPDSYEFDKSSSPELPDSYETDESSYPELPDSYETDESSSSELPDSYETDEPSSSELPDRYETNELSKESGFEKELLRDMVHIISVEAKDFVRRINMQVEKRCKGKRSIICEAVPKGLYLLERLIDTLMHQLALDPRKTRSSFGTREIKNELANITNEIQKFMHTTISKVRSICGGSNSAVCNAYLKGIGLVEKVIGKLSNIA
ncbi:uncharacterized protein LOC128995162 [Macrosteles quadrilineatus]|uniref:uncharacterized protein LOC128995162 n=1 Tax=Macrosteles quadrilineatus TaxID=74068 RepID=UPI0023E213A0|nr:uncharacterized protein LOC128995162 [Macrosteles quadrilineatus]